MFIRIISFLVVILILTSCDGGLNVSGNIYESNILSKGTDSVVIELRDKDFKLLVSSISNKSGSFFLNKIIPPFEEKYYLVFEKNGYKKDTIKIIGPDTKLVINHLMTHY